MTPNQRGHMATYIGRRKFLATLLGGAGGWPLMARAQEAAARTLGLQFHVLHASSERELDAAFATLVQLQAGALVIGADPLFNSRSEQLAALTIRHRVPAIYQFREFVSAGGLMAYG